MKNYIICIFISFIFSIIMIYNLDKIIYKEDNISIFDKFKSNNNKCLNCKDELPLKYMYLSVPSKCYDCEKQYLNQNLNPIYTQPTKCFSCL